ncbi:PepSY-associated TM helix domain protein [Nitrospina gracilis 3/211]|uniref:PepSY-associated TM helix domain protein n=1 Tax=Nitrospina gracilis (strain 3/211) TaxID=1266370 RepID=M1YVL6_NITG3|nr:MULTISPECIES: PepSY-associated TM helix domain-containing protein [Nitrospina]MCF8722694.1 putative iron-regulated membrane protein [Nitrospina sp. Nb-3]CCQ89635.1 PepSY-associated TM helix domain protein [Nitrospina gracilis 3/211]
MMTSNPSPQRLRQWVRRAHLVLAFTAGLVLVVSGLSGSLLVYHKEIDHALNPDLWRVEPEKGPHRIDASLDAVRQAHPGGLIGLVRLPREPDHAMEVWVRKADVIQKVYVNPYTTRLLGVRGDHDGLMGTLHDLHVHLLAGETGETVMGFIGLVAMVLLGTGMVLWWPRGGRWSGAFRIGWKETGVRKVFRLHRFIGIVSIGFLVFSIATGAGMVFHKTVNVVLESVLGGPMRPMPPKLDSAVAQSLSAEQLMARGQSILPEATLIFLRLPSTPDAPYVLRMRFDENPHPNGSTYLALHPETGEPTMVHSFRQASSGQVVSDLKYPLHIGRFWGEAGRLLTVIIGLSPALLFVSGFLFWKRRRRASSKIADTILRPPSAATNLSEVSNESVS